MKYQLYSLETYNEGLERAGVTVKDNVRSASEKLLSVVIGSQETVKELRGPDRKYLGKETVVYRYGIPYEMIVAYLAENFPALETSYHSLRWYMVRMRERAGQTTSQKGMSKAQLDQLKVRGSEALPERRERARK